MANRYPIFVLLLVFVLAGCGKKDKRADQQLVTEKSTPAFLASIPADTPYVMASLEPVPMGPLFQWAQLFDGMMGGMTDEIDAVLADEYLDPSTKATFALMAELKGKFTREGLESLGLSSSPRMALYGLGPLPVVKMDLSDEAKFEAMLARVEERSGLRRTTETLGNHTFWTYQSGVDDLLVMTVQNRQVTFGVTPRAAAPTFVAYVVGEKTPASSMEKDERLAQIASTWGLERFSVGYVDLARLAQMYVDPQPGLNDEMLRAVTPDLPVASDACKAEITALAGAAPRIVFGYEEWSNSGATFAAAWELTNTLGQELVGAKTPAPLSASQLTQDAALSVALGIDVGKLVDVVRNRALEIRNNPYQCEWFQPINQAAGEVATATSSFLPPIVTQIRGAAVVVTDVANRQAPTQQAPPSGVNPDDLPPSFGAPSSLSAKGVVAVGSQDAVSLFDFLKSFVPSFASLVARPDGTPTPLPAVPGMEFLDLPQVVLTPQLLIVTSGDGMSDDIARLAEPAGESPLIAIAYDYQKLWNFVGSRQSLPAFGKLMGTATLEFDPQPNGIHFRARVPMAAAAGGTTP